MIDFCRDYTFCINVRLSFSVGYTNEHSSHLPDRENRDALEIEAEAILRRLEAEEEAEKARKEFLKEIEEQQKLR